MKLSEVKEGLKCEVVDIADQDVMVQALRFGIDAGTCITIEKNIAGGPVIVCKNHLEIAIGREFARSIEVTVKS